MALALRAGGSGTVCVSLGEREDIKPTQASRSKAFWTGSEGGIGLLGGYPAESDRCKPGSGLSEKRRLGEGVMGAGFAFLKTFVWRRD